jgi:phage terminase small subunit
LAATRSRIARRDHDRELKMEQTVLGLPIKTSNSNVIPIPLAGTANEAASDMVRYAAELGMTPSARFRLAVDGVGRAALSPPTTVH